jgi:hypothetical protein
VTGVFDWLLFASIPIRTSRACEREDALLAGRVESVQLLREALENPVAL